MRESGKVRSRVRVVVGVTIRVCVKAMQKGPMVTRKRTVIPTILIVTHFMTLRRALQNKFLIAPNVDINPLPTAIFSHGGAHPLPWTPLLMHCSLPCYVEGLSDKMVSHGEPDEEDEGGW